VSFAVYELERREWLHPVSVNRKMAMTRIQTNPIKTIEFYGIMVWQ